MEIPLSESDFVIFEDIVENSQLPDAQVIESLQSQEFKDPMIQDFVADLEADVGFSEAQPDAVD